MFYPWFVFLPLIALAANTMHDFLKKRQAIYKEGEKIRVPKFYFFASCIFIAVLLVVMIFLSIFTKDFDDLTDKIGFYFLNLMYIIAILRCLYVIARYLNWFIVLEKDGFIYRTIFRKVYNVDYRKIKNIEIGKQSFLIKTANKTFHIDIRAAISDIQINRLIEYAIANKPKYKEGSKIRLSKSYLFLSCLLFTVFSSLLILVAFILSIARDTSKIEPVEYFVYAIIILIFIGFLLALLYYLNWYIILENDRYIYRTIFRKIYRVNYNDIEKFKIGIYSIRMKTAEKTFRVDLIDSQTIGIDALIEKIKNHKGG